MVAPPAMYGRNPGTYSQRSSLPCTRRFLSRSYAPNVREHLLAWDFLENTTDGRSCGQPRVGQALSADRLDHRIQPLKRVPFDVAFIQSEGELVQIAAKVLATHAVIHAVVATFQDCPDTFNSVRVGQTSRILASRMINRIVTEEKPVKVGEHQVLIGIELRSEFDVVMDALRSLLHAALWHGCGEGSARTALPHSQNGSLAHRATSGFEFLVLVFIAFLAADEALIQFHDTLELGEFRPTARLSQPMQHEPSRFLSDANLFRQLQTGDALTSGYKQVHRIEPLMQGNMAALEDRACTDREIKLAWVTAIEPTLSCGDVPFGLAGRAGNAVLPDARFQKEPCRLRRWRFGESTLASLSVPRIRPALAPAADIAEWVKYFHGLPASGTDAIIMCDFVIYLRPCMNQQVNFLAADRAHLRGRQLFMGGVAAAINPAIETLGVKPCHRVHIGLHGLNVPYSRTFVKGIKYIIPFVIVPSFPLSWRFGYSDILRRRYCQNSREKLLDDIQ